MESKHYSYDEAYDATLKYFGGDELAARVGEQVCPEGLVRQYL